jgi:malate synthase
MTNPAILVDGEEIFEGIMDALVTPLLSIADIRSTNLYESFYFRLYYGYQQLITMELPMHP